jgi:hypothetical protein
MHRRFQASLLVLSLGVACRQATEVRTTPDARNVPPPSGVPKAWSDVGVPRAGLLRVSPESNEHGFYADYAGGDRAALLAEVSRGLVNAGYSQSCTAVDGQVLGFFDGRRQLALKIDMLPELSLSLFDANGKEPLLHGLCFGRYRAGPSHTLSQDEKEALARDIEAGEGEQDAPSPSPRL